MLKAKLDVFVPLVDDDGIDAILRGPDGRKIDLQIKARSGDVLFGDAALFAGLSHPVVREGYYFLFYSERMDHMWLMSSADFMGASHENKRGKNVGQRSIWLNGKNSRNRIEHPRPQYHRWSITLDGVHDFSRLHAVLKTGLDPVVVPR
jgi:hypothetical protein